MVNLLTSYITTSLTSTVQFCGVILVMHIREREYLKNRGVNGLYIKKNFAIRRISVPIVARFINIIQMDLI